MYETITSQVKLGAVTLKNCIIFAPTSMGLPDYPDYKLAVWQESPHCGNAGVLMEKLRPLVGCSIAVFTVSMKRSVQNEVCNCI